MSKQGFGEILNFMSGVRIVALLCAIISSNAPLCADGCVGFELMNQQCMLAASCRRLYLSHGCIQRNYKVPTMPQNALSSLVVHFCMQ